MSPCPTCKGTGYNSVPITSPIYGEVTEGRHAQAIAAAAVWDRTPPSERKGRRPFYSSCGDLPHWMLSQMVDAPWLNREPHYRVGLNLNLLCREPIGSNELAIEPDGDSVFHPGDVLILNAYAGTAHAVVVYSYNPKGRILVSGEYGQPHGAMRRAQLTATRWRLTRGTAPINSWLRLADVIMDAERRGALKPMPADT